MRLAGVAAAQKKNANCVFLQLTAVFDIHAASHCLIRSFTAHIFCFIRSSALRDERA